MIKIITTGSSGFLCKNIIPFFEEKGSEIISLNALAAFDVDISRPFSLSIPNKYDAVIHAAGKAHSVPHSDKEKEEFWKVNFEGTQNLCKAFENSGALPRNFVFVSTVAVYGLEKGENISEDTPLNGISPYAKSKIAAEKWLRQWAKENNVNLLIFRLPLVAGSNPPGNLGAMIQGIKSGRYFRIGRANARKSIVLASDIADIIEKSMGKSGTYNLTDGYHPSFSELEDLIAFQLKKKSPRSLPLIVAKTLARTGDLIGDKFPINSTRLEKITGTLTFSDEKARRELGWNPHRVLDEFRIN